MADIWDHVLKKNLVYQIKVINVSGRCYLLLLVRVGRKYGLGGQYSNGLLIKVLLKVTRGYIVMSITCIYVIMYQGGICKESFL